MPKDTYENRALFMMMWHGAPAEDCQRAFPEWSRTLQSLKSGSTDETLWLRDFCAKALELRNVALTAAPASAEREKAKRAFLAGWMRYDTASDVDTQRAHTEFDTWWPEVTP